MHLDSKNTRVSRDKEGSGETEWGTSQSGEGKELGTSTTPADRESQIPSAERNQKAVIGEKRGGRPDPSPRHYIKEL